VEIWSIDLNQPEPFIKAAGDCLSLEEKSRAERFKNSAARHRYVIAHVALRRLLAAKTTLTPQDIPLRAGPHGKPCLTGTLTDRLHFNLSHSGNLVLIAISRDAEVGIDVERIRVLRDAAQIAERFFSRAETAVFKSLPEAEQNTAFFNLWTRKEALVKATGDGIAHGLARFEVASDAEARLLAVDGDAARAAQWTLRGFSPAPGYAAAVAVQQPHAQFSFHEYGPELP